MKSVFSWFITSMAVIFWIFRVVITIMETIRVDFIIKPIDTNIEIALLFITIPCIILILKRNILGGIAYFGLYGWYFGTALAETLKNIIENSVQILPMSVAIEAIVCVAAIIIALSNLIDIILTRFGKNDNPNRKVDWFYKNKNYDRNLDERADKNNYRIY